MNNTALLSKKERLFFTFSGTFAVVLHIGFFTREPSIAAMIFFPSLVALYMLYPHFYTKLQKIILCKRVFFVVRLIDHVIRSFAFAIVAAVVTGSLTGIIYALSHVTEMNTTILYFPLIVLYWMFFFSLLACFCAPVFAIELVVYSLVRCKAMKRKIIPS